MITCNTKTWLRYRRQYNISECFASQTIKFSILTHAVENTNANKHQSIPFQALLDSQWRTFSHAQQSMAKFSYQSHQTNIFYNHEVSNKDNMRQFKQENRKQPKQEVKRCCGP
jgi:hypothetical protein